MPKTLQVIADLTLHHENGDVKINNDDEGNVVVHFPDNKTFNLLLETKLPVKPEAEVIRKANAVLYEQHQPIIVRVNNEDWMVLGRSKKPEIKYGKVAVPYLTKSFSWKTAFYVVGSSLSAALIYLFIKKRN